MLKSNPCFFEDKVRTNFYVDGFNLYYRAVRGTPYKWLDLSKVCQSLTPSHQIGRIRYFTAPVQARPDNPQAHIRQGTYIRALETITNLTVHYGQFRTRRKWRPLANPIPGLPHVVEIVDTEEKGTDVNLAAYLLMDALDRAYDQAVIISNDADLATPIRMVRDKLGLPMGLVNPNLDLRALAPKELTDVATFVRRLRPNTLSVCQFPPQLTDANGQITKPSGW